MLDESGRLWYHPFIKEATVMSDPRDDRVPDEPRDDDDAPDDAYEPTYPDGSVIHECWHGDE